MTEHQNTDRQPIFSARDIVVRFQLRGKVLTAIRGASLDLYPGETLAIVGESGSGKSVLTKSFIGMLDKNGRMEGGSLSLLGQEYPGMQSEKEWLKIRGKQIAMVFQDPMTSLNPVKTVGQQIREVITWHFNTPKEQAKQEAIRLLGLVGIPNPEQRYRQYPHQFSGGMRQRVVIATAIACRPRVLICDEPTTALDVTVQAQILQLIRELKDELDMSVIYITHDLGVVAHVADRVAVMYAGQIVEEGLVGEIFKDARHPYTKALLQSLPQLGVRGRPLHAIKGSPPNLYKDIVGDAFAPRNPDAMQIDYLYEPPRFQVSPTHFAKTWLLHEQAQAYARSLELAKAKQPPQGAYEVAGQGKSPLLSVKNLTVSFKLGRKAFHAVDDVSFDIFPGETLSLVGESGSGKTTVGKAIMKICHTNAGEIHFEGQQINRKMSKAELSAYRQAVQMIFQDPMASLNERAKVEYIISEGLYNFKLFESDRERREKVAAAMHSVGLMAEQVTRFPHEFSGGQRQRIGIARSLIVKPRLVVADEPISALDVSIRAQVINLLNQMKAEQNLTYLFIAHDLSVVRFISDRIAVMYKGKLVELADSESLFKRPLHPYTRALMAAAPVPDPDIERHKQSAVYNPAAHDYSQEQPGWLLAEPGHYVRASQIELAEWMNLSIKNQGAGL